MAEEKSAGDGAASGKGGRKGLIFTIIGMQIVIVAAVAWLLLRPHEAATTPTAAPPEHAAEGESSAAGTPVYLTFKPPFVVNISTANGRMRFLQVAVELMAHDNAPIDAAENIMPLLRNNLLLLFGNQTLKDVTSLEGKQKLREAALAEVNRVLKERNLPGGIEAVYFSSFVVQ